MDNEYIESNQIQGTIVGVKKSEESYELMKIFLDYCCNINLIAPDLIAGGVDDTFIAHREDQSILSLLCKKADVKVHKDPTQYGRLPEKYGKGKYIYGFDNAKDSYKPMLVLHRSGQMKFSTCYRQLLCSVLPTRISKMFIK